MYHLNLTVLLYFSYLIHCIFVSSYSTSKSKENGNMLLSNILMNKNRNNDLTELSFNEVYDMKRPKGRNIKNPEMSNSNNNNNNNNAYNNINGGLKMRKNVNKLFNTLYPNDINKEEIENNNYNNVNEKQSYINNMNNINHNNNNDNNNNSNYNDMIYKNEEDDLQLMNDIENVKIINNDIQNNNLIKEENNKTSSYEKQNTTFDIVGNNEKMKSESKFAIVNYLKEFFQNSPYVKNFQNAIEVFFNKYDQRILESTVFFNFDETLF
ncbi:conserved Plasmodium protein, unknown function [Plasmodium sp. gorilla clade G3]|nr:conserved Plasmodium protein, unknown function [Plasmodium sp. gorilla clade G3]